MQYTNHTDKIETLKRYENYGFQIAYYLLNNESLATQAVARACIELYKLQTFFLESSSDQKQRVKRMFVMCSLAIKAEDQGTLQP